jgi:23S rRNA (uracil1939-C5)-methyltransferase
MIARSGGQVVLVDGTLPGERIVARIERVARGVAYADTISVAEPSRDRREPDGDRRCGGCLYAHIAYPRQLELKSLAIGDAFARIGRLPLAEPPVVAPSLPEGYRMRARLHHVDGRLGFLREATHQVCDARATRQLLPSTCDALDQLEDVLSTPSDRIQAVVVSESQDASQRVVHVEATGRMAAAVSARLAAITGVSGVAVADTERGVTRVLAGSPFITDVLHDVDGTSITLRRHGLAFFQGNRFLLRYLVAHVSSLIESGSTVMDLYAGGGVFALAAVQWRGAHVTAVEGDGLAADDLVVNLAATSGDAAVAHLAVETFVQSRAPQGEIVVVDPPRTGLSAEATAGVIRLAGERVIYVSCDVATLARDARHLVEGGFGLAQITAFDLFPNTPHVETVAVFDRR